jgi:hypothetical protein
MMAGGPGMDMLVPISVHAFRPRFRLGVVGEPLLSFF